MKNWAGNQIFHPQKVLSPFSTQEAQAMVKEHAENNQKIRMRGSSHSWTGLIATNDSFLHLDKMQGVIHVDKTNHRITAKAGTKLKAFAAEAFRQNMALPNQGDVDHQSLAGALSTGTHGTGITLQSMSNQIKAMTLINGLGDVLHLDEHENNQLLKALAVSFGSAGLMTEATIQMMPAYKLQVESFAEDMKQSLEKVKSRLSLNRHLEMFYFPVGDWSMVKTMNQTQATPTPTSALARINETLLENWLYQAFNVMALQSGHYKTLDKLMRRFVGHKSFVQWSHQAFPSERTVRFMEMEYNLPLEKFETVFEEVKWTIKKEKFETLFPIEIRFVKGDDLWLSPAYQRDSVYLAVHTYISENYLPYFQKMEEIFKRHNGRPHWGKWHSQTYQTLRQLYPKFDDFIRIRNELDPKKLWYNQHLKILLDDQN